MKIRLEVSLEHAVAFLSDPYAGELAPLDVDERPIASAEGCIAFRVRPSFEGGADITVSSEGPPASNEPDFQGTMNCDSGVISISDSGRFNYCMFPIDGKRVQIQIWTTFGQEDGMWIKLSPLIEY
ncbi:MAG: hypothetical protein ACI9KA_002201 [Parasphingorhabdus sp.]|jgi:hypothetical protein